MSRRKIGHLGIAIALLTASGLFGALTYPMRDDGDRKGTASRWVAQLPPCSSAVARGLPCIIEGELATPHAADVDGLVAHRAEQRHVDDEGDEWWSVEYYFGRPLHIDSPDGPFRVVNGNYVLVAPVRSAPCLASDFVAGSRCDRRMGIAAGDAVCAIGTWEGDGAVRADAVAWGSRDDHVIRLKDDQTLGGMAAWSGWVTAIVLALFGVLELFLALGWISARDGE